MSAGDQLTNSLNGGRPRVEIDLGLLGVLAEAGCSEAEVAAMLRRHEQANHPNDPIAFSLSTIKRRLKEPEYKEAWETGVNVGKAKLRLQMIKQSKLMNAAGVSQTQFLAVNWLGMTSNKSAVAHSGRLDSAVEVSSARDRVNRKLDTISQRIASRVAGIAAAAGATSAPAVA